MRIETRAGGVSKGFLCGEMVKEAEMDYRRYYHLERYLFDEVTPRFYQAKQLTAFDFFCIVIWKANRAKSKVAERLLSRGFDDLERAVSALTAAVAKEQDNKARLKVLWDWGFRLPMASAILTVLYPQEFTVYDIRVCDQLGTFHNTRYRTNFDLLWSEYEEYIGAVHRKVAEDYDLRDKDRWLWGKSFKEQLDGDILTQFKKPREEKETNA